MISLCSKSSHARRNVQWGLYISLQLQREDDARLVGWWWTEFNEERYFGLLQCRYSTNKQKLGLWNSTIYSSATATYLRKESGRKQDTMTRMQACCGRSSDSEGECISACVACGRGADPRLHLYMRLRFRLCRKYHSARRPLLPCWYLQASIFFLHKLMYCSSNYRWVGKCGTMRDMTCQPTKMAS